MTAQVLKSHLPVSRSFLYRLHSDPTHPVTWRYQSQRHEDITPLLGRGGIWDGVRCSSRVGLSPSHQDHPELDSPKSPFPPLLTEELPRSQCDCEDSSPTRKPPTATPAQRSVRQMHGPLPYFQQRWVTLPCTSSSATSWSTLGHQSPPGTVHGSTCSPEPWDWACWSSPLGSHSASYWAAIWSHQTSGHAPDTWPMSWETGIGYVRSGCKLTVPNMRNIIFNINFNPADKGRERRNSQVSGTLELWYALSHTSVDSQWLS